MTATAALTTGEQTVSNYQRLASPEGLVGRLATELSPGLPSDGACQAMVFDHAGDVEALLKSEVCACVVVGSSRPTQAKALRLSEEQLATFDIKPAALVFNRLRRVF